jgi:hypothetical protein
MEQHLFSVCQKYELLEKQNILLIQQVAELQQRERAAKVRERESSHREHDILRRLANLERLSSCFIW